MIKSRACRSLAILGLLCCVLSVRSQSVDPPREGYLILERASFDDCDTLLSYDSLVVTIDSIVGDSVYWQLNVYDTEDQEILADNYLLSPLQDTGAVYGLSSLGTIDGMAFCFAPQCSGTIGLPGDPLIYIEDTLIQHPCLDVTTSHSLMISGDYYYFLNEDREIFAGLDFIEREALRMVANVSSTYVQELGNVQLYPNPVSDVLIISMADAQQCDLTIYGSTGMLWRVQHPEIIGDNIHVMVDHLPAGTYVVRLSSSRGLWTRRFLKF